MVDDEREVEEDGEPFTGEQEDEVEENVNQILREDERIQSVALIDRILEICLQFVESDHMEDSEEDEEGVQDQGCDVGEGCECEPHLLPTTRER